MQWFLVEERASRLANLSSAINLQEDLRIGTLFRSLTTRYVSKVLVVSIMIAQVLTGYHGVFQH